MKRSFRRLSAFIVPALLLAGCGKDYTPPLLPTAGPASPLGQVLDLEVELPELYIFGAMSRGVRLEVRFEIDEVGYGEFPARVVFGPARYDMRYAEVRDLSDGETVVTITPDRWVPGIIGPLRIENTTFDLILNGALQDGGWTVSGGAYETQTAGEGTFQGWRRHRFLVAGTDFFSEVGRVEEVALVKNHEIVVRHELEQVSSDPVLRVTGRSAFAVNRFTFDNLQQLDPDSSFLTSWQAAVGSGSNPHDVLVVADDRAYVTRYEPPFNDVAVFNPANGVISASIPLESLAENVDGTPRPDRMRMAEGTVFVGLQDVDRTFTRFSEGKLAVIDPELEELAGVIPLGGKNPGAIDVLRGADGRTRLYVALSGILEGLQSQELSGGVVVVDAVNRTVERLALDDNTVQGNIGALALASEELGYVTVTDVNFHNRVIAFDPSRGEFRRDVWDSFDLIPELEVDTGGILAIPDRSFFQPRLCLYRPAADPADPETLIGCGALQLPPFSLESLD